MLIRFARRDRIVPVDVYVVGCPPRRKRPLLRAVEVQDKIDQMTLAKRPTEVRLKPHMVEEFNAGYWWQKRQSPDKKSTTHNAGE